MNKSIKIIILEFIDLVSINQKRKKDKLCKKLKKNKLIDRFWSTLSYLNVS